MKKQLLTAMLVASTVATASCFVSSPAQALSFNVGANSVNLTSADIGKSFTIYFNGVQNNTSNVINGLTSQALFTLNSWTTNAAGHTEAAFTVDLKNTSSSPITASRVSVLGFNVSQALQGVGNPNGPVNPNGPNDTRVSGIFTQDRSGNVPDGIGDRDVCFSEQNCAGGANGGVTFNTTGTFNPILAFTGSISNFTLDSFFVRYQSINGEINGREVENVSAAGVGRIPTPALLPGLVGLGMSFLRKKKQMEKAV